MDWVGIAGGVLALVSGALVLFASSLRARRVAERDVAERLSAQRATRQLPQDESVESHSLEIPTQTFHSSAAWRPIKAGEVVLLAIACAVLGTIAIAGTVLLVAFRQNDVSYYLISVASIGVPVVALVIVATGVGLELRKKGRLQRETWALAVSLVHSGERAPKEQSWPPNAQGRVYDDDKAHDEEMRLALRAGSSASRLRTAQAFLDHRNALISAGSTALVAEIDRYLDRHQTIDRVS